MITGQMQHSMNQKLYQALSHGNTRLYRFFFGGVYGNHDISKQKWRYLGIFAFLHGKRNDVGRAFMVQIFLIDGRYLDVVDDYERQLVIRIAQVV